MDDLSTGRASRVGDAALIDLELSGAERRRGSAPDDRRASASTASSTSPPRSKWASRCSAHVLHAPERRRDDQPARRDGVERTSPPRSSRRRPRPTGNPSTDEVDEEARCDPISTYGETKLVGEWLCRRSADAWGLAVFSLRYFNVAGAGWPDLGDPASLNLIPIVFDRLVRGDKPQVFGDDYPTPDGSCIRDYVHVLDLAEAHLTALDALGEAGHSVFNIGTGQGSSVFEVIEEIGRTTGLDAVPRGRRASAGRPGPARGERRQGGR